MLSRLTNTRDLHKPIVELFRGSSYQLALSRDLTELILGLWGN